MKKDRKFYQTSDFLESKTCLDRRAMSSRIWARLLGEAKGCSKDGQAKFRAILDAGCGIGTLVEHFKANRISCDEYHGIDIQKDLLENARKRMTDGIYKGVCGKAEFHHLSVYDLAEIGSMKNSTEDRRLPKQFDLVCAASLAEHVEVDEMLEGIWQVLRPGGLILLPINYDGETVLEPMPEREKEKRIIENFNNQAIRGQVYEGRVGGEPYCGRKLFHSLVRNGFDVLEFDTEDWVISPADTYPFYEEHERVFLQAVVQAIYEANLEPSIWRRPLEVTSNRRYEPEPGEDDKKLAKGWLDQRMAQINQGDLVYICRQTGALGRKAEVPLKYESVAAGS